MQTSKSLQPILYDESHYLGDRGLINASKWLAELASAYDESHAATDLLEFIRSSDNIVSATTNTRRPFSSKYYLAKRYFDCRESHKTIHLLRDTSDVEEKWLWLYARFMCAQLALATSDESPPKLDEFHAILADIGTTNDPFLLYLQALALSEAKQRKPAIVSLVKSLKCYNSNWSAWLKLADLIDGEEELIAISHDLPECLLAKFFFLHATLEVHRASDSLRYDLGVLRTLFPDSIHLRAEAALLEYHLRDFDLAERLFDELGEQDPYRLDELDTYSNILYVMGKGGKLAQIARKYSAVDQHRPEVCCLIGNLFSLRSDHAKAIAMFRQALKLDRGYLTAWTLMGHEYVEMSNTHAAIEAYRRACQANRKDYRAWYGLGQAYELLGMHAYALRYFQKATALRPFDSRMWQALAQCYGKLAKPHEVLKCLKRAQLFVEADDISNLRKLGDHCLTMGLFEEAAMYWTRAISSVTAPRGQMGHALQDVAHLYNALASYEMGEYHVAQGKPRVIGDLALANMYLVNVATLNNEDADTAKRLQRKLRELQLL